MSSISIYVSGLQWTLEKQREMVPDCQPDNIARGFVSGGRQICIVKMRFMENHSKRRSGHSSVNRIVQSAFAYITMICYSKKNCQFILFLFTTSFTLYPIDMMDF